MLLLSIILLIESPFDEMPLTLEHRALQQVFDAVVQEDGQVNYRFLHENAELRAKLNQYVIALDQVNPLDLKDQATKIAFFSNVYNACTLLGVINAWPVDSVRDIKRFFGFFTQDIWRIGGRTYSLNDIEKEWLRPLDVRIHFTINCASTSCPRLDKTLFTASNVQAAMENLARSFVLDESKNSFRKDGVWQLSKIFDWYEGDFGGKDKVIAFIREIKPDLEQPRRIQYQEYDWSLNGPVSL